MTNPALASGRLLPRPDRRGPLRYRSEQRTSGSYATSRRLCGIWVPQAAFRAGTLIRVEGATSTNSSTFAISIGGNAATRGSGVNTVFTNGGLTTRGYSMIFQQESDGHIVTFASAGAWIGTSPLAITRGTATIFLQPLNFVEVSTNSTCTFAHCILEVIPPEQQQWSQYQELLDT